MQLNFSIVCVYHQKAYIAAVAEDLFYGSNYPFEKYNLNNRLVKT